MLLSSNVDTWKSHDRESTDTCIVKTSHHYTLKHTTCFRLHNQHIKWDDKVVDTRNQRSISLSELSNVKELEHKHTLFFLAAVWSTAVRKPVGKVNPGSQNRTGGWVVMAHTENCSTRTERSLVQAPRGFCEGYAFPQRGGTWAWWIQSNTSSKSDDMTTNPLIPFSSSIREVLIVTRRLL